MCCITAFLYSRGIGKKTFHVIISEDNQEIQLEIPFVTFIGFSPQHTCLSALIAAWKHHQKKLRKLGFKASEPTSIMVYEHHGEHGMFCYPLLSHKAYIAQAMLR